MTVLVGSTSPATGLASGAGVNFIYGQKFTAAASGTANQFLFYAASNSGGTAKFRPVVYAVSGGVPTGAPLATGSEVTVSGAAQWWTSTISVAITAGSSYLLTLMSGPITGSGASVYADTTPTGAYWDALSGTYPTPNNPWHTGGTETRYWDFYLQVANTTVSPTGISRTPAMGNPFITTATDLAVGAAGIGQAAPTLGAPTITQSPPSFYYFTPPTVKQKPIGGHRLFEFFGGLDVGVTVLTFDGVNYLSSQYWDNDSLLEASEVYLGGHIYIVNGAVADRLARAGWSQLLTDTSTGVVYAQPSTGSVSPGSDGGPVPITPGPTSPPPVITPPVITPPVVTPPPPPPPVDPGTTTTTTTVQMGDVTAEASWDNAGAGYLVGDTYAAPHDGSLTTLHYYVKGGASPYNFRPVIYAATDLTHPLDGALLWNSSAIQVASNQAAGWIAVTLDTPLAVTSGSFYTIGFQTDEAGGGASWALAASGGHSSFANGQHINSGPSATFTGPFTGTGTASYSMYADISYTTTTTTGGGGGGAGGTAIVPFAPTGPDVTTGWTSTDAPVFCDAFTGTVLDRNYWGYATTLPGNTAAYALGNNPSYETQVYAGDGSKEAVGSGLTLTATPGSYTGPDGKVYHFLSGAINTRPKDATNTRWTAQTTTSFTFNPNLATHVIEASIQVDPNFVNAWPAFWAVPTGYTWPPELDVLEFLTGSSDQQIPRATVHYKNASGVNTEVSGGGAKSTVYSTDYYKYTMQVGPGGIYVWVNGTRILTVTDPAILAKVLPYYYYLLVNLAVTGTPGTAMVMKVKYVAAWQQGSGGYTGGGTATGTITPTP